jgi:hypothetical protein
MLYSTWLQQFDNEVLTPHQTWDTWLHYGRILNDSPQLVQLVKDATLARKVILLIRLSINISLIYSFVSAGN